MVNNHLHNSERVDCENILEKGSQVNPVNKSKSKDCHTENPIN